MRRILITAFVSLLVGATALASDTVHYTYDAAGRLVSVAHASGATLTYTYDASGNLLRREVVSGLIYADGFESGDVTAWTTSSPSRRQPGPAELVSDLLVAQPLRRAPVRSPGSRTGPAPPSTSCRKSTGLSAGPSRRWLCCAHSE